MLRLVKQISKHKPSICCEYQDDFRKPLVFECGREMMHHQHGEDNAKPLIGKQQAFNGPNQELRGHLVTVRLPAGADNLLGPGSGPTARPASPGCNWAQTMA